MTAAPLRLAIWGLGPHARRRLLPAAAAAAGVQLSGVCSRDTAQVQACAATWGCRAWTEAGDMLADAAVDAVCVATPSGLHAEHGSRVLVAGKHLLAEKPFTVRRDTTEQLLALSRTRHLAVSEGMMYLHHPHFLQLARYVGEGRLGNVVSVSCRFGVPPLERPGFRDDPALGGSALLDVGCYPVSALLALFPAAEQTVMGAATHTAPGARVDTHGHATISLSNGADAWLEWRTGCAYRNEIFIWGDAASVWTDLIFSKPDTHVPEFHFRDKHGHAHRETGAAGCHFVAMLQQFAALTADRREAEAERRRIQRRADILADIMITAQGGSAAPSQGISA